ncbi:MAG: hypothetical protein U9R00_03725 [Patescibacteria group bacterium]|nr:hypothetical protein [Patescibacteria group bacterium]
MEKPPINSPEHKKITISEALITIQGIYGQISQMGANDSEKYQLDEISKRVKSLEISPVEGITQAEQIRDRKQAYH